MGAFHDNLVQSFKNLISKYLTASDNLVFQFSKDTTTGKYGYKDSNGDFVPFKTSHTTTKSITAGTSNETTDMGEDHEFRYVTVLPTPTQTKTVTATTSAQIVTPDSGNFLSNVTVEPQIHTDTYTVTSNDTKDMGESHNYRYVSVSVPAYSATKYIFATSGGASAAVMSVTKCVVSNNTVSLYNTSTNTAVGASGSAYGFSWSYANMTWSVSGNGYSFTMNWVGATKTI